MREIKFRAWDKITKQVCPVVSLNHEINSGELINVILSECNAEFVSRNIEDVDLMQYTELKDKNGIDIYEGDICKKEDGLIIEVKWIDNGFKGEANIKRRYYGEEFLDVIEVELGNNTHDKRWGVEVIGNIYENPELLE